MAAETFTSDTNTDTGETPPSHTARHMKTDRTDTKKENKVEFSDLISDSRLFPTC